ncbi:MAG: aconitate hydratase AcnA [Coriobacteriales bacterium]|jgi:aconitate hydratase
MAQQPSGVVRELVVGGKGYRYFAVDAVEGSRDLPYALKVLLENVLRLGSASGQGVSAAREVVEAGLAGETGSEVEFMPARVLFQDFTGVPVMVDFAAMREAVVSLGGSAQRVNPRIHCDLVIDHSVIGDVAGCPQAASENERIEFRRNAERYRFLKWAQGSLRNLSVLPPAAGICHQLDIELLSPGVAVDDAPQDGGSPLAYFDTVVGTDSHTTTVGGIGILGWGVGGIEAEAASLGQPIPLLVPRTYGIHMTGHLPEGVSAMDLALTIAQILRARGVVGCYVEAFGEGVSTLSAPMRTCVSNMSPEYGSTCLLFPVDERTLEYYRTTGRSAEQVALIEAYAKAQGFWHDPSRRARYADVIELDLGTVEHVIAGPSRPHERIPFARVAQATREVTVRHGFDPEGGVTVQIDGESVTLGNGTVAIAAITSCTTTADPSMMVASGLLARNAARKGIFAKPWVKRLLSPGSHASELLLERAGLLGDLERQGFYVAGFGCMSCIGNSGPIRRELHDVAGSIDLAAVVSGNRNFEGRISPDVGQNYLGSPATVVAYALAGSVSFDFETTPLGVGRDGSPVYLRDIWPDDAEVAELVSRHVTPELYTTATEGIDRGGKAWRELSAEPSDTFAWDEDSTYIRRPPYFDGMTLDLPESRPISSARALLRLGDFITTDHISPAGSIAPDSPAARYLRGRGVRDEDFNTYGSRRGNHEVMERGTFANVKLRNLMADGRVGCWARDMLTGELGSVWDTSCDYRAHGVPMVVIAGKMYGSGSSRDWAAKGPMLQGVRAVIAESLERIHRSNLIGMGILPLQFVDGQSAQSLGLDGTETYDIPAIDFDHARLPLTIRVGATRADGTRVDFDALVRVDTPTEALYMRNGGILQYMVRVMARESAR